ncbi:MAG: F0F1 ATP synthase subunit alpha [Candidatus Levybacteria bacterium RIFCSPHIGHO2_01_FULL_37_17]|nr:MAG: F0F1 ATP synthase subunit alpha [Candidatus Levybacteria bacterium RIFCSPHIGHO2_01_FULL_37_17]OGH36706.1 MAG: F0F1 ATP synthase subunit alpha [Candidatus Levybacteria bacterium RIFCSPLOWO2_01_FULL_38_23]
MKTSEQIINDLEKKLKNFTDSKTVSNIGTVYKNTDGVITASGLTNVKMGEIVSFNNGTEGVVLNLDEDSVSIILLGDGTEIKEGDKVKASGKLLSINVSENILGRIIDPLGNPLDGKNKVENGKNMPLERIAAGVIEREPVNTPLKTGIKAIDSMIPIGRGQRELIIGDRGTGKTAVAIDTIINQKNEQKKVICVYVAIGQKKSTIAQVIERLKETKSIGYSIVVSASASDPASLLYLAPYTGVAIAEYFMEEGKDVLVVYDDLTKHAWAYRQISLVLRRPAGREAYPGDIFYLHSRLLERAVKMNKENGGGSITALPIIETQANDISAYIPTNVISITDGQIFFLTDLFYSGQRPAIDAGNSVSRVGGAAQTPLIKSVAGKMRLELAQYNNLAAFAQFGSELDEATLKQLERGKRTIEILKQSQYQPLLENLEFMSLWLVTSGHLDDIDLSQIQTFEKEYHKFIEKKYPKILDSLTKGQKPDEKLILQLEKTVSEFKKIFK